MRILNWRVHKIGSTFLHGLRVKLPQRIVSDAPHKRRFKAQCAQTCQRIRNRAARRLNAVFHCIIQRFRALFFDQLHDAFFNAHPLKKRIT